MPWPQDKALRASVNNFGYGGTNAHLILEAYSVARSNEERPIDSHIKGQTNGLTNGLTNGQTSENPNGLTNGHAHDLKNDSQPQTNGYVNGKRDVSQPASSRVFVISSKDSETTQRISKQMSSYINEASATGRHEFSLDDLAHTLGERRSRFPWATAVRARSLSELADKLGSADRKPTKSNRQPRIGYVFNGQGGQWHAMGRELMQAYPVYNYAMHVADRILTAYGADWSLVGKPRVPCTVPETLY